MGQPRVWITRTRPGADRTAERLAALGYRPVIAPLLQVHAIVGAMQTAPAPDTIACIALTSPNTLDAIAEALQAFRHVPVFAVGDVTANAALAAGMTDVRSASGDIHALADLIGSTAPHGTVFAPGAKEPAGDLPALLPDRAVMRLPVYETRPTDTEAPADVDTVLVHSPRAGRILASTLTEAKAASLRAVCISPAAAKPLSGLPFIKIDVSATPDEEGVISTLGNSPQAV